MDPHADGHAVSVHDIELDIEAGEYLEQTCENALNTSPRSADAENSAEPRSDPIKPAKIRRSSTTLSISSALNDASDEWLPSNDLNMLPSLWSTKVDWAVRSALSVAIGACYAVPASYDLPGQASTVLAIVLAISCSQGPSLGATLRQAYDTLTGAMMGVVATIIVLQMARPFDGVSRLCRDWATFCLYSLALFACLSRPCLTMTQKKRCCLVCVVGTLSNTAAGYDKAWHWPLTTLIAVSVGCAAAVISMLLPLPKARLASTEMRTRCRFQIAVQHALLAAQHEMTQHNNQAILASTEQLSQVLSDNAALMKSIVPMVKAEFWVLPGLATRLCGLADHFELQARAIGGRQTTIRDRHGDVSACQANFREITHEAWLRLLDCLHATNEEAVSAEVESRPVNDELTSKLNGAMQGLDDQMELARRTLLFQDSESYVVPEQGEDRHIDSCRRSATLFFTRRLVMTAAAPPPLLVGQPIRTCTCKDIFAAIWGGLRALCRQPNEQQFRDAAKKTFALLLGALLVFVPALRELEPEGLWASVAIVVIFSESIGGTLNSGMLRAGGTMIGSMFALLTLEVFRFSQAWHVYPWAVAVILVGWSGFCGLFRNSQSHGYQAMVASLTPVVVLVSGFSGFNRALHLPMDRIKLNAIGILIFVVVDNFMWPKSARSDVNERQAAILRAIGDSISQALSPASASVADIECSSTASAVDDDQPQAAAAGLSMFSSVQILVKAAETEPLLWRAPFQAALHTQALGTELRALRAAVSLHVATRQVAPGEFPTELKEVLQSFSSDVAACLEAAATALEERQKFHGSSHESKRLSVACASSLMALSSAAKPVRARLDEYFQNAFVTHKQMRSNEDASSINACFFLCLRFCSLMRQLGTELRAIEVQEAKTAHF